MGITKLLDCFFNEANYAKAPVALSQILGGYLDLNASLQQTLQYTSLSVDDLSAMKFGVTDYIANLRKQMSGQSYNEKPIYRPQLIAR